jgi:maleate cis-trans isomerase
MTVAYARSGLIGTLTPQANTTVEPEFAILLPPGFGAITARMVSPAPDLAARLVTYIERLDDWVAQFAGAPLAAIAFACTGSSYLVGAAAERALVDAATARLGVPVVTAGLAVVDALGVLSARRVAFVSPYPRALTEASLAYWAGFGIAAAQVVEARAASPGAHPIYGIGAADVAAAMGALDATAGFDAVVMLGTGMPTLQMIRDRPRIGTAPVLSCTLATAWRATIAVRGEAPSAASLCAWTDRPEWAARLRGRDD